MSLLLPGIRKAALKLPRTPFVCRQCLRYKSPTAPAQIPGLMRNITGTTRTSTTRTTTTRKISPTLFSSAIPSTASAASTAAPSQAAKRAFPETNSKSVGYWLIGSAASVFGIVVFGGLTRLTESG